MLQKVTRILCVVVFAHLTTISYSQLSTAFSFGIMAAADEAKPAQVADFNSSPVLLNGNNKCLSVTNGVAVFMAKNTEAFKFSCVIDEFAGRPIQIQAYPNPARTETTLKSTVTLFTETAISIQLVNQNGQLMQTISAKASQIGNGLKIDLKLIPAGVYFVYFIKDNQPISTQKLIVVK